MDEQITNPLPEEPQLSEKKMISWGKIVIGLFILLDISLIAYISNKNFMPVTRTQNESKQSISLTPLPSTPTQIPTISAVATIPPTTAPYATVKPLTSSPSPLPTNITQTPKTAATYTISGYLFLDTNKNQSRDDGEPGLAGVRVLFISLGKTLYTDNGGRYSQSGLAPGTYNVYVDTPEGKSLTSENIHFVTITNNDTTSDFGFH